MFSVVIIARNESKNIEACIRSALKISDDVVVVDSGSSDNTVELGRKAGARVFEYGWHGYGANKNFGNQQAKYDWIISIDGDEIISDPLLQSIKKLVPIDGTVYQLNSMVQYSGHWIRHCGWYPRWKHRIFNKTECRWNDAQVHEDLTPLHDKEIQKIKGDLLHYSYESIDEHKLKIQEYAHLKAQGWIEKGSRPPIGKRIFGPYFNFIKTYFLKLGFLDGRAGWVIAIMDARLARLEIQAFDSLLKNQSQ